MEQSWKYEGRFNDRVRAQRDIIKICESKGLFLF